MLGMKTVGMGSQVRIGRKRRLLFVLSTQLSMHKGWDKWERKEWSAKWVNRSKESRSAGW